MYGYAVIIIVWPVFIKIDTDNYMIIKSVQAVHKILKLIADIYMYQMIIIALITLKRLKRLIVKKETSIWIKLDIMVILAFLLYVSMLSFIQVIG
jgi:hypothetical protein